MASCTGGSTFLAAPRFFVVVAAGDAAVAFFPPLFVGSNLRKKNEDIKLQSQIAFL